MGRLFRFEQWYLRLLALSCVLVAKLWLFRVNYIPRADIGRPSDNIGKYLHVDIVDSSCAPSEMFIFPWSLGLLAVGAGAASVSGSGLFTLAVFSESQPLIGEGVSAIAGCSSCWGYTAGADSAGEGKVKTCSWSMEIADIGDKNGWVWPSISVWHSNSWFRSNWPYGLLIWLTSMIHNITETLSRPKVDRAADVQFVCRPLF